MMLLLEAEDILFAYRRKTVVGPLDLRIEEGGVTALLGPNGGGKTTLLKLLLGLLRPQRGTIRLRGRDVGRMSQRDLARQLAYVPQVHKEAFGFRVFDVVLMGRMPHRSFFSAYSNNDRAIAFRALEKLRMGDLADRPYTEVSGGERQLTLIARALAQGAGVFVMDEPTSGLDYGNQVRLLEQMGMLADEGYTFVFTTHHPDHALAIADRVVMMRHGSIVSDGAPRSALTPEKVGELYGLAGGYFQGGDAGGFGMPELRGNAARLD